MTLTLFCVNVLLVHIAIGIVIGRDRGRAHVVVLRLGFFLIVDVINRINDQGRLLGRELHFVGAQIARVIELTILAVAALNGFEQIVSKIRELAL